MTKPLCILDIDGVLVPYRPNAGGLAVSGSTRRVPHHMKALTQALAKVFELRYCSLWNERSQNLAPLLGEIPYQHVHGAVTVKPWLRNKAAPIREACHGRPAVVFDDHIPAELVVWADRREQPTLLRKIPGHDGLRHYDVVSAVRWWTEQRC